ncbi:MULTISPECIES: hypothetical protein [Paenibacillus]|uniref:Uncharacterized protein n=2 Tax=Paenibacillus TaxID=44249 RepID=A0ABX2Z9G3_PAEPO|nr:MULTISPECIES: hypothetical protein [Paenibacillus]MDR6779100.1 hypothetical protein [Paenibacillus peoriae]ODA07931.1 hypothetical protein A7312_07805 [Paenibacillus polymyxa]OME75013.1 hypothetical protein BK119_00060 [Paenibacillus peoriae]
MRKSSSKKVDCRNEIIIVLPVDLLDRDELLDYFRAKGILADEIGIWNNICEPDAKEKFKRMEEELRDTKRKLRTLANEVKRKNCAIADIITPIILGEKIKF